VPEGRLSTGFIIAGAYADKVRKTLFAQTKPLGVDSQEVVRASAELNRVLFEILTTELGIGKGDVVRVQVDYVIEGGKISWKYDSLKVEAFKRMDDELVAAKVKEGVAKALKALAQAAAQAASAETAPAAPAAPPAPVLAGVAEAKLLGENAYGEKIIALKGEDGKTVGAVSVSTFGGEILLDAIVVKPTGEPVRIVSKYVGNVEDLEEVEVLSEVLSKGEARPISKEAAKKMLKDKLEGLA